jgi:hypothetical protein
MENIIEKNVIWLLYNLGNFLNDFLVTYRRISIILITQGN